MKKVTPLSLRLMGPDGKAPLRVRLPGIGVILLFASVFLGIGIPLLYMSLISPYLQSIGARGWVEVPCEIVSSEVQSHDSGDAVTYSPHIVYKYSYEGTEFTSDRYDFRGGSSSFHNREAEPVHSHPAGSDSICFVNPDHPAEAVLNRDFTVGDLWFFYVPMGAFLLLFLLFAVRWKGRKERVWLPGIYSKLQRHRPAGSFSDSGLRRLTQEHSFLAQYFGFALMVIFWNSIVYALFLHDSGFRGVMNNPVEMLAFFLFGGIGALFLIGWVYGLVTGLLFNWPVVLTEKTILKLGDRFRIGWRLPGGWSPVTAFELRIVNAEKAQKSSGDSTRQVERILLELPVASLKRMKDVQRGEETVEIPAGAMHSFERGSCEVAWIVRLAGKQFGIIPYWVDFPIVVLPKEWKRREEMSR